MCTWEKKQAISLSTVESIHVLGCLIWGEEKQEGGLMILRAIKRFLGVLQKVLLGKELVSLKFVTKSRHRAFSSDFEFQIFVAH